MYGGTYFGSAPRGGKLTNGIVYFIKSGIILTKKSIYTPIKSLITANQKKSFLARMGLLAFDKSSEFIKRALFATRKISYFEKKNALPVDKRTFLEKMAVYIADKRSFVIKMALVILRKSTVIGRLGLFFQYQYKIITKQLLIAFKQFPGYGNIYTGDNLGYTDKYAAGDGAAYSEKYPAQTPEYTDKYKEE